MYVNVKTVSLQTDHIWPRKDQITRYPYLYWQNYMLLLSCMYSFYFYVSHRPPYTKYYPFGFLNCIEISFRHDKRKGGLEVICDNVHYKEQVLGWHYSFASRPLPHFISQLKLWLQVNLGVAWEQGEVRGQYRGNMSEWRKRATCDMLSKHKHAGKIYTQLISCCKQGYIAMASHVTWPRSEAPPQSLGTRPITTCYI